MIHREGLCQLFREQPELAAARAAPICNLAIEACTVYSALWESVVRTCQGRLASSLAEEPPPDEDSDPLSNTSSTPQAREPPRIPVRQRAFSHGDHCSSAVERRRCSSFAQARAPSPPTGGAASPSDSGGDDEAFERALQVALERASAPMLHPHLRLACEFPPQADPTLLQRDRA